MTNTIVIAEINNKQLSSVTNELVTAALKMSSNCKLVVPCDDSSIAEEAAKISGVSSVIAAKSDIFSSYDFLLNKKYKIKINQKTLERVKNYFQ